MIEKQKTIRGEVTLSGVGLHTGTHTTVRLKPAPENSGITFIRVDLHGKPTIKVCPENVALNPQMPRCTGIGKEDVAIYTVEHLMSVLCGLGIDNLIIEINGNELPGLDGSGIEFLKAIKKAGVVEQNAERKFIKIKEPIGVSYNGSAIYIMPGDEFKVSYTLNYDHPFLQTQFFSTKLNEQIFETDIAPCRTFCLEEETKLLQSSNLGKGANFDNTLVVGKQGVIKNKVRFTNEFARHKVLDLIGDLFLLGKPIQGEIFAIKSGHTLNLQLLKKIYKQGGHAEIPSFLPAHKLGDEKTLDINQIMRILPHRYPFLLLDRIVDLEKGKRAVAIKNVTINDNFFEGHFPTRPIMPGVLMVEALAQAAGIVALTHENHFKQLALFMGADGVKFRKMVLPGDQLFLEVEIVRDRSKTAVFRGQAKVNGEVVTEADILISFVEASFLD
jgi:UDP-3-O-[3-hydroxymyristoyl] N-acetylglucosamine deacetylase/3-hydroxyacyl-[acyl-carrier-protein] dehydratase